MNIPKAKSALTPKNELPLSSKDAFIRVIFYYGLLIVFNLVFQLGLPPLINLANITIDYYVIEATVVGVVGFLLTILFMTFDQKKLTSLGFELHQKYLLLAIMAAITTTIALACAYYFEILGGVVSLKLMLENRYLIENLAKPNQLIDYSVIVFITFFGIAIGEEIIFRGYLQNIFESQTGIIKATFATSVLFGFLHSILLLMGDKQVLQSMIAVGVSATIFGFVFTYASKITGGNLTLPIFIHGIWNSIIFFFQTQYDYEDVFKIFSEIFSQIVAALVLISLLYMINKYTNVFHSE